MTSPTQTIRDFIDFSQKKPELFTDEISASIANILSNLPDDVEQISDAIFEWCEKYPQIYNAFIQIPSSILGSDDRAPGNIPTELTAKQMKQELNNRFPQRKPPSQDKPRNQPSSFLPNK
ncbi:MAG: hypothetical protein V7K47_03055 [Nostoc sp.]